MYFWSKWEYRQPITQHLKKKWQEKAYQELNIIHQVINYSLACVIIYKIKMWNAQYILFTQLGYALANTYIWVLNNFAVQGGDKNDMLVVQSLRNSQMVAILNASFAILLNTALAALTNNSFKGRYLLNTPFLGSKSGKMFVQKYGLASFLFLFSFFCSSQALALFMDANFLINASSAEFSSSEYAEIALERGFLLALIGNRLLLITFPFLLWIFGPLPAVLSSVALVWWLYELDFPGKITKKA